VNINTINEKGKVEFLDRTLEENKMKDLLKRAQIKGLTFYWNSAEQTACFVTSENYNDNYRKKFLKENIQKADSNNSALQTILKISLESTLTFANINKETKDTEPRYKIDIDLKPINLTLNSDQVNQMISLANYFTKMMLNRKKKYELPNLNYNQLTNEVYLFRTDLREFLLNCDDPEISFAEEIQNPKKKREAEFLLKPFSRLPNDEFSEAAKEIILKIEKKRILSMIEKKTTKKTGGYFGFWKSGEAEAAQTAEELKKIESYFDDFIKANSDQIGKDIEKGFLIQLNLNMSESSIFLIHGKSQQGMLAVSKDMKLQFELLKIDYDSIFNFGFSVNDIETYFIQKYPKSEHYKKTSIMKKTNLAQNKNLAAFSLKRKYTFSETQKNDLIEIEGEIQGTEFIFMPEILMVMKKFFTFKPSKTDIADLAYEKMAEISKNAQNQIKTFIVEYSATLKVNIACNSVAIVLPLAEKLGENSDCWVINVEDCKIKTLEKTSREEEKAEYNTFSYSLDRINVKYYETIAIYQDMKKSLALNNQYTNKKVFSLLADTKFGIHAKVIANKDKIFEDPDVILSVEIGPIVTDLNKTMVKRLLALKDCFDFSTEKEFNDYLETEKQLIMKNCDGLFKVFSEDPYDLSGKWSKYVMVSSGFYLYFFRDSQEVKPTRHLFIKRAKVTSDNTNFDYPNVLKIKTKFGEATIAMETEEDVKKLIQVIEKKNQEYAKASLSVQISEEELKETEALEKPKDINPNKQIVKMSLTLEGIGLRLYDEQYNLTDEALIKGLTLEFIQKSLSQTIIADLGDIYLTDYVAKRTHEEGNQILTSKPISDGQEIKTKDLIRFEFNIYQEMHPKFQENLVEKEFTLHINTLNLNWIPERMNYLMKFFTDPIRENIEENNTRASEIGVRPANLITIEVEKQFIARKTNKHETTTATKGLIKIKQVALTLTTRTSWIKLGSIYVKKLNMNVSIDKDKTNLKGTLANIQVFDLTNYPQSNLSSAISPQELVGVGKKESLLSFDVELREEQYIKKQENSVNIVANVELNSAKINYIHQPVMRIVDYVANFMLGFEFGVYTDLKKRVENAIKTTSTPRFMDLNVKINHPVIILKSRADAPVQFELDLGQIIVKNSVKKDTARILKPIQNLENLFAETFDVQTSEIRFTKMVGGTSESTELTGFKLSLLCERCLWDKETVLAYGIPVEEWHLYIDNSFKINASLTPVLIKINQKDYLDLMDCILDNVVFDDGRDSDYHLEEELGTELNILNTPTPIDFSLNINNLSIVLFDQIINFPIGNIIALGATISFKKDRLQNKKVQFSAFDLKGDYFESEKSGVIYERTLLGQKLEEKSFDFKEIGQTLSDISAASLNEAIKNGESNEKNVTIDVLIESNKNQEIECRIKEIKLMLILGIILRLKDFFKLYTTTKEEEESKLKIIFLIDSPKCTYI